MTDYLAPSPWLSFADSSGNPLSGGKLFTYLNNTTTKVTTYTDASGATPNTNPIILDSYGQCDCWLPPGQLFTFTLAPSTDTDPPTNIIKSRNNVSAGGAVATVNFAADTGIVNASVATVAGIISFFPDLTMTLAVAVTNTGPATLNVNGTGAKSILLQNGGLLGGGELQAGGQYVLQYTGAAWQILGLSITPDRLRTAAEIAAGVTPTNYAYAPGNVMRYGADPTGIANSDTALANAVACMGGTGFVFLPKGTFKTSATLVINQPGNIYGVGYDTVLNTSSATNDIIDVTSAGVYIYDLQFNSSVTRTAGYCINVSGTNLNYFRGERLYCTTGCFNGIGFTGGGQDSLARLIDCLIIPPVSGTGIVISTTTNNVDVVLENIFMPFPTAGSQPAAGVQIYNSGDVTLDHVSTVHCGNGLNITPANGQNVQAVYVVDSFFDSGSGNGINTNPAAGGIINYLKVIDTWCCTNGNGISLGAAGTGTVQVAEVLNCTCSNNTGQGIVTTSAVLRHTIYGGDESHNVNGIYEGLNVTNFKIIGNISGPVGQFSTNTGYGLVLAGGNDAFQIVDNDFQSNGNPSNVTIGTLPGTVAQTYIFRDNLGFVTDSQGSITLTAAGTTTVVTHNLAYTPSAQQITLTPTTSLGTAAQAWVSAVGSTTFTISTNANPGAGVIMGWRASALH